MKDLLYKMFEHKSLSREESRRVLLNIADGRYNDAQLSAFMTVFLMRSITQDELSGFRDAVLERRNPVNLDDYEPSTSSAPEVTARIHSTSPPPTCFVVAGSGRKVGQTRQLRSKFGIGRIKCDDAARGQVHQRQRPSAPFA